jgi:hypothetical protein
VSTLRRMALATIHEREGDLIGERRADEILVGRK